MKYKLLKDLPGIAVGAEFIENDDTDTFDILGSSYIHCVGKHYAISNPDFFEPIVEKKTYDSIEKGDTVWVIESGGIRLSGFSNGYRRSGTFLTREEAEDEHKRREWVVRKEKFVPKEGENYFMPIENGDIDTDVHSGYAHNIHIINLGLAFRTREDCQYAIDNHDLIRLFYNIR